MYTIRRDPSSYASYYYSQYWTMHCHQHHQQIIFQNRNTIKSKQQTFWSNKFANKYDQQFALNNNSLKSIETLPVYRAPCTFQNSLESTNNTSSSSSCCNNGYPTGVYRRSPLSSSSSSCVPDVYSPGPQSSGNCSPPPPSSNLPPPPSEWLH